MSRRIVICMDGTGNEVDKKGSNVLKLYRHLRKDDEQLVHYIPGVGTLDGERLVAFWQKIQALRGLVFGLGLEDDVLDAYRYLSRTYLGAKAKSKAWKKARADSAALAQELGLEPPAEQENQHFEDDRIYVVGFSRGAYAARVLAGFIHNFGLLPPEELHMAAQVFRAYRRLTEEPKIDADMNGAERADKVKDHFSEMRLYGKVLNPDVTVSIRALGLFDTVSSMIRFRPLLRNIRQFQSLIAFGNHTSVNRNSSVRIVRQALAVDERRSMFRADHWEPSDFYFTRFRSDGHQRTQLVEQRWFPGCHGDIGGAQVEQEAGIGKLTALWMLDGLAKDDMAADDEDNAHRARKGEPPLANREYGLTLKQGARERYFEGSAAAQAEDDETYSAPDPLAPIHDSMRQLWPLLEFVPKSLERRESTERRGFIWWYLPLREPRVIDFDQVIDQSVHDRIAGDPTYKPPNVPKDPTEL